jgi:CheY-like chemotaxis protein
VTPADAAKPRILVVDDDHANLRTFRIVFRAEYDAELALSGDEALAALAAGPFDVALVDYAMPGMNGLQLLARLQRDHATVGRILVTGYPDLPELAAAARSGLASAVVMKPWDREALERIIDEQVRVARDRRLERGGIDAA